MSLDPSPFGANQPTVSGSGVRAASCDGVRSTASEALPVVGPFAQPSVAETLTAYDPSGTTAPEVALPSQTALKVLPMPDFEKTSAPPASRTRRCQVADSDRRPEIVAVSAIESPLGEKRLSVDERPDDRGRAVARQEVAGLDEAVDRGVVQALDVDHGRAVRGGHPGGLDHAEARPGREGAVRVAGIGRGQAGRIAVEARAIRADRSVAGDDQVGRIAGGAPVALAQDVGRRDRAVTDERAIEAGRRGLGIRERGRAGRPLRGERRRRCLRHSAGSATGARWSDGS